MLSLESIACSSRVPKPRGNFTFYISHCASSFIQNVNTEVGVGNMQSATQKWDDSDDQPTVPGSIPEAMVKTGDTKPVEVVFLASPEEFCVQVSISPVKYYVLLHVLNKI
jgi:hypothetical protein